MKFIKVRESSSGARVNKIYDKGQVVFSKSNSSDVHVPQLLAVIQQHLLKSGVKMTEQQILQKVLDSDQIKMLNKSAGISPILYDTIAKNALEQGFFAAIKDIDIPKAPKFNAIVFNRLKIIIFNQHPEFFPLRNHVEKKYIKNSNWVLVPDSSLSASYNSVTTAAAFADGTFAFNVPFMQELLNFANVKAIRPKNKVFVCNGGVIPDEYGYIEFLILHELMHFSHGDFYFKKKLNGDAKIINYVGDFRSNYQLVKSGYEQLPVGLYSDSINYDRQNTYKEMYDLVKFELDKFKDEDRDKLEDLMKELMDDHTEEDHPDDESEKEEKEKNKGKDGDEDGPEGQGQGKGEGEGEGEGKGKVEGKGKGEGKGELNDEAAKELDKAFNETKKKMKNASDSDNGDDGAQQGESKSGSPKEHGGYSTQTGNNSGFTKAQVKPVMNWKALVKKMVVSSTTFEIEDSYSKAHRRSAVNIISAKSTGVAAVRPGERSVDMEMAKIAFVVDSSGSMHGSLATVYANIESAFRGVPGISPKFVLVKFSSGSSMYSCDLKSDKSHAITDVKSFLKGDIGTNLVSTKTIFTESENGGTNFDGEIISNISQLLAANFNVMVFSDHDLSVTPNIENLKSLNSSARNKFFIVCDSNDSFSAVSSAMGSVPNNMSHL